MAELEVKERQAGDVTILDMNGSIRIGEGSIAMRDAVRGLVSQGKKKVLLNLGGVSYMDSSGVGELIARLSKKLSGPQPFFWAVSPKLLERNEIFGGIFFKKLPE